MMALTRRYSKLPQPAVLKQILKRCSSLGKKPPLQLQPAYSPEFQDRLPLDVPKGHFVVYVGEFTRTRHIVPLSVLTRPEFHTLLRRAEEEFGFDYHNGLTLPCDELVFDSLMSTAGRTCRRPCPQISSDNSETRSRKEKWDN